MKPINTNLFLSLIVFVLCFGCAESTVLTKYSVKRQYPKLKDYKLSLTLPAASRFITPKNKSGVVFLLSNNGEKPITIKDYQAKEENNLRIYYRLYDENIKQFIPSQDLWEKSEPSPNRILIDAPLVINPLNNVLIAATFPFVDVPGKYLLVAELISETVEVRSDMFLIEVAQ